MNQIDEERTPVQEDRRLNMSNSECLLVKFLDDKDALDVGFRCWLVDQDLLVESNLRDAIKNQIETMISWPNSEVYSADIMKRKLKAISAKRKLNKWIPDQRIKIVESGGKRIDYYDTGIRI